MKKILIASDIHGDAQTTARLLEAYRKSGAERLILLGDILYHGPRNDLPIGYAPKKVIELLNGMRDQILCVRGNCEAEVDQMVLDFPVLSETLALCVCERNMIATHGHHVDFANLNTLRAGEVLLTGHTHVPVARRIGDVIHINPGSVSISKEDSPKSYVLYEDGIFSFRRLENDEEYMRFCI